VDAGISIRVLVDGQVVEMNMADYLVGVVAAEMPANFEPEALKAQAVAARTYLLYKMLVNPSTAHPDADVCDDYTCCSAYATDEELKSRWGDGYVAYREKIVSAVTAVDGLYLCYNSEPILAVFIPPPTV
jgi:stage II sporulation protein D